MDEDLQNINQKIQSSIDLLEMRKDPNMKQLHKLMHTILIFENYQDKQQEANRVFWSKKDSVKTELGGEEGNGRSSACEQRELKRK